MPDSTIPPRNDDPTAGGPGAGSVPGLSQGPGEPAIDRPSSGSSKGGSSKGGSSKGGSSNGDSGFAEGGHTLVSDGPLVAPENAYSGLRPRDLGKALVGQKIDSVLLEEFVGGGGMGAVFRGRDVALQRNVAVKVLATDNPTGGDIVRRFEIEAQSAARLDHPNIARIHHVGEDNGLQYIVFEYIDGQNLRDMVNDYGPQPLANVVSYGLQLADALTHAWQRKVVHRDIKPSNILVTSSGQAKLVDMGLARVHQPDQAETELTATGATLGTFDYIAPEQARDPRGADIRSDIYSLGCTLYFLLIGKPPFPEGTALQKLLQHQGDQPPDIRATRPDVPKPLARVLEKMLAKRPEARQQDPLQLAKELAALAASLGVAAPTSTLLSAAAAEGQENWWRRQAPWMAPVVLLITAGFLLPTLWSPAAPPRVFPEIPQAATNASTEESVPPSSVSPAPLETPPLEFDLRMNEKSPAKPPDGAPIEEETSEQSPFEPLLLGEELAPTSGPGESAGPTAPPLDEPPPFKARPSSTEGDASPAGTDATPLLDPATAP